MRLKEIHEVELSSLCQLRCVYCPHPQLEREKEHMTRAAWEATLRMIGELCRAGTQTEVALTGIGEAALHPLFIDWTEELRAVLGPSRPITLSTNGICFGESKGLDDRALRRLLACDPHVFVSLHRPELATPALNRLVQLGFRVSTNVQFATSALDWAGQVKWAATMQRSECQYLARGWGVVRQDGRITTCCMDAHTKHAFGTVHDASDTLDMRPHTLCASCQLDVPRSMLATGGPVPQPVHLHLVGER